MYAGRGGPPPARATATGARAWGAVSLVFGALVLAGSALPWYADTTFARFDDIGSAWPLVAIGVVGLLGGMDGLRGSPVGPAMAAGIGSVFILVQAEQVRALTEVSGLSMGAGGVAWTGAALAAVVLAIAALSRVGADRTEGTAPGWLGVVVLVAAAVWVVGMIVPAAPGISVGDHLFGGTVFYDIVNVAYIAVPAAFAVVAAVTRSRVANGLAAGCLAYFAVAAVTAATSIDGAAFYWVGGSFWPLLGGALAAAVGACVAILLASHQATAPASPVPLPGVRPVAPFLPAAALAVLPIAGIVGAVHYAGDDPFDGPAADTFDDPFEGDTVEDPDDAGDGGGPGGSYDVVCTDLVDSTISSTWQDVDGAIHVIVLVDNNCDIGQRLDDPSASFTLTDGGATVADATFDFTTDPVVIPAYSTAEAELVFGPDTFVDLEAVETLGLGADTTYGAGSLGLTYRYICTDAPDATAATTGGEVAGDATGRPVVPQTTDETDALSRLQEIADADQPFIDSDVIDRWVPQISSKKPNVTLPNGSVWDAVSILDDHRSWRESFPRVRLLWSGDYSTFEQSDFWVTIVAVPYNTAAEALAWCDAQALPHEDCYAKLISRTHPHQDSTEHR
jgi:hypothetical protein